MQCILWFCMLARVFWHFYWGRWTRAESFFPVASESRTCTSMWMANQIWKHHWLQMMCTMWSWRYGVHVILLPFEIWMTWKLVVKFNCGIKLSTRKCIVYWRFGQCSFYNSRLRIYRCDWQVWMSFWWVPWMFSSGKICLEVIPCRGLMEFWVYLSWAANFKVLSIFVWWGLNIYGIFLHRMQHGWIVK
jgi:hypothetical protein